MNWRTDDLPNAFQIHKVKISVLLFFLSCCEGPVIAQTKGKGAGRVVDGKDGSPLPEANVMIQGTRSMPLQTAMTNFT
jgi:hypothetical protein